MADLGSRICIIGQSGGGKSTLAAAIGSHLDLPVVHLDQYRHVPGSKWRLRSDDEFAELHGLAVDGDRWVIEGNYSKLMPERLRRATGLIVIDVSMPTSLFRYFRRTLRPTARIGGLDGTNDTVSWTMVKYIVRNTRSNKRRRRATFERSSLPKVFLSGLGAIRRFYTSEDLERPYAHRYRH